MPIGILWRYPRRSRHSKEDMTDVVTDKIAFFSRWREIKEVCVIPAKAGTHASWALTIFLK